MEEPSKIKIKVIVLKDDERIEKEQLENVCCKILRNVDSYNKEKIPTKKQG